MSNQKIVCIDGIIGVGKSTLIKSLKEMYNCFEEPVEQWTLLPNLYSNMKKYAGPFQFQVLFSQWDQQQTFKNIEGLIVVERSPETSLAIFAKLLKDSGSFEEDAFRVYRQFNQLLGRIPDHYIHLSCDVQSAWERIQRRDRFGEEKITFDYLCDLKVEYDRFFENHQRVTVINAMQPAIQVKYDTIAALSNLQAQHGLNQREEKELKSLLRTK